MPLVFTQNDVSLAGVEYADVLGKVYEYPSRYRKLIQPGEQFVYYRGRRRADGTAQTPAYIGCGTVGTVSEAGARFRCTVVEYRLFKEPVPFKDGDTYREPEANHRKAVGFYFQVGVRPIEREAYDAIVTAGLGRVPTKRAAVERTPKSSTESTKSTTNEEIQMLALKLAMVEIRRQWPHAKVFRAPVGQHYSFIVRHSSGDTHHLAIKATAADEPRVRLSEGDVQYAGSHAATYSLWVFYSLDEKARTGMLIKRKGKITDDDVDLRAAVHGGRLKNAKSGKSVGPPPQ